MIIIAVMMIIILIGNKQLLYKIEFFACVPQRLV